MNISLKQRRFLIIWCIFHVIALTVNLLQIKGEIETTCNGDDRFSCAQNMLTDYYREEDGTFWPFVKMYDSFGYGNPYAPNSSHTPLFRGIFYNYTIGAFVVYMIVGFAVVFLPKLWSSPANKTRA